MTGSAKQNGRADAAKGDWNPPTYGVFDSHDKVEKVIEERGEYREGFYDKKNEMDKNK